MQIQTSTIRDNWEVAERTAAGETNWIPADVPGHVHLDLVRAGVIGDPFWRMQERGCQWVDRADWTYRTTFPVDAERLAARGPHGRHFLHFHGLDTLARVFLNGALVGSAENFFLPHRFDVTDALREGDNELRVEFDSALRVGQERATAYLGDGTSERGKQSYFNFSPRAFVRKAQYMFGWDWGPEFVSCGLWQNVDLVTVPVAEIVGWKYDCERTGENTVRVTVTAEIERRDADAPLTLRAALSALPDGIPADAEVPAGPGRVAVTVTLPEANVERRSPNGSGAPRLHALHLRLDAAAQTLDERHASLGFRTVELVREPDADGNGEGFKFRVNGVDTFIKGANWIPDHSFPAIISPEQLRQRLTQARDAGFNMLRVWGGGLYETEDFYNLCDELGLLVWQDFAFACSSYPDDDDGFVEQIRAEASGAVRRIRNHPSLALWCGGNENLELHQDRWAGETQARRFFGDRLIHEILPAVLAAHDPQTPYWPNSPYGGPKATSEDHGDSHYWNVWHSKLPGSNGDWTNYLLSRSRFSSEFGFSGPCGPAAWDRCAAPEDRGIRSPVIRWHDKTRKGYETYLGYIALHFLEPQTLDDLIRYGQANQAEALRCGVEHWRRLKGRCWGTLFWQLNDCWPVHSWSIIDSEGEPKAAYYAAKRFYAPLLLSLVRDGDNVAAHLINDLPEAVPGRITLCALTFDGEEIARQTGACTAPANAASGAALTLALPAGILTERAADVFIHAAFAADGGGLTGENFLLLAEPRDLRLPDPGLSWNLAAGGPGEATVAVSAQRFAGYVRLRVNAPAEPPAWSENWFHLAPGQTRTITVRGLPPGLPSHALRADHL